jgi:hypothetical protein
MDIVATVLAIADRVGQETLVKLPRAPTTATIMVNVSMASATAEPDLLVMTVLFEHAPQIVMAMDDV